LLWIANGADLTTRLRSLLGPPVVAVETYAVGPAGPTFDHASYDGLLRRHVDEGWVDYAGLRAEEAELDAYLAALAQAPFDDLGRDEKLALLINAYNAATLKLILDYYPLESINDIPAARRWSDRRWVVGGRTWSLDEIEHEQIRPHFVEPRIHFALVCAAIGCPILRSEAYDAARLDAQLEAQMVYCHNHERWFRIDANGQNVQLSSLYDWYRTDFASADRTVLEFIAPYVEPLRVALAAGVMPAVRFLDYDWTLNDVANRRGSE
jgi:hypothetical protein